MGSAAQRALDANKQPSNSVLRGFLGRTIFTGSYLLTVIFATRQLASCVRYGIVISKDRRSGLCLIGKTMEPQCCVCCSRQALIERIDGITQTAKVKLFCRRYALSLSYTKSRANFEASGKSFTNNNWSTPKFVKSNPRPLE